MGVLKRLVSLLLIVTLCGCATKMESIRGKYHNPEATDATIVKDNAECEEEGEKAAKGWLIAAWVTMPLALTVIGAVIPLGLSGTAAAKQTSTHDRCMAKRGYLPT